MAPINTLPRTCLASLLTGIAFLSANGGSAQDCAGLQIVSLRYAAFSDTALEVVVSNPSMEVFFGYPQFCLVDAEGDTLAREPMFFFGIGEGEQMHRMYLLPGVTLPPTPFTGTLVLFYSTGEGDQVCTFPITNADLCPPACPQFSVFLYAQFGSFTTSTFPWNITDSDGVVVGSGSLSIDLAAWQEDMDTLCLEPGPYTLHMSQPEPSGMEFQVGVSQDDYLADSPSATLIAGGSAELPFLYYAACVDAASSITEAEVSPPTVVMDGQRLIITDPNGHPLGEVLLLDAMGRCVRRATATSSSARIDLANVAAGVHLITVRNTRTSTQRIVLP